MSFLRGFSIAMGANSILFVLTFLNKKLLFVLFSESDNGLYFLIQQNALLFALIFGEWLRLTNMNLAGKEPGNTRLLSANSICYTLFVGILVLLPAMLVVRGGATFLDIPAFYLLPMIGIGISLMFRGFFQSFLLVHKHTLFYGISFVLWGVTILVMNVIFLYVFKLSIFYAIVSLLIASFVSALWAFASSLIKYGTSLKPSLTLFKMSGSLGGRSTLAVAGMFFMVRLHVFVIPLLAAETEKGIYVLGLFYIGFTIYQLLQRGSDVAGSVLYAHTTGIDEHDGYSLTAGVCRNMLWLLVLACVAAGLAGKFLIYIIAHQRFFNAYIPMLLMLPGMVFVNMGTIINSSYWGRGYPHYIIWAPYVAGLMGLALDFLLIPHFGASGASVSFSVVGILWFVYLVYVFKKDSGIPLKMILFPRMTELRGMLYRSRLIKVHDSESGSSHSMQ